MKDIFSFLKKRINTPSLQEIFCAIKNLGRNEKRIFFILFIIFILSAGVLIYKVNDKISITVPDNGGIITEGILGTPRFINPLLAISDADRDMTSLIYSGLMRPDSSGGLELDLAEKYDVSKDGLEYTFILKPDLVWHDGEQIIVDDIIFTIQQAKDPILKSPKRAGWEGVIVEKIDDRTVKFILEKSYTPFLENTILGILPQHLWKDASSELMTFSELNINPIGSGPFKIKSVDKDSSGIIKTYYLVSNKKFALGQPYIKEIDLKFYASEEKLIEAYQKGDVNSLSAISPQTLENIKRKDGKLEVFYLPRVFGIFFNQNNSKVFTQNEVRQALNLATDKKKIIDEVLKGLGSEIDSPIPHGVFGAKEYGGDIFSIEKAKELLLKNGWKLNEETGILEKKDKKEIIILEFSIATSNMPELKQTAELIKSMWEAIGAKVNIKIFEIGDLNQNVIRPRKYDAILFGEIVGRDPDPFVFWHSSQRNDPGLNIALYANINADKLLEKARTISDKEERKEIYLQFQEEVEKDVPAIFLYSPYFVYVVPQSLNGVRELESITTSSERFAQVYKWYIKTSKIWKIFVKTEN
ncbi:peptide ABC transporter substrate-binding protein [Patescibacteria group bacterium]|nr:peptide ABC transporter substrate-binding protein [Patescibacteria group bacterium]